MDQITNPEIGGAVAACIAVGVFMGRLASELALECLSGIARIVGQFYRRRRPDAYENQPKPSTASV